MHYASFLTPCALGRAETQIGKGRKETVTNCHALKMRAADGKMRLTDVADT